MHKDLSWNILFIIDYFSHYQSISIFISINIRISISISIRIYKVVMCFLRMTNIPLFTRVRADMGQCSLAKVH